MPSSRRNATVLALLTAVSAALLVAGSSASGAGTPVGRLDPTFSPGGLAGVTDVVAERQFLDVAVQQDGKAVAVSDRGNGDFFVTRYNTDGSLDLGFGIAGNGTARVDIGAAGQYDEAFAVAVDAQDRIVVAGAGGAAHTDFAMVRLSPDGKTAQLNAHVHVGNAADSSTARDVAFQSDGTIVLAGTARVAGDSDFALVRFDGASGAVIGAPVTESLGTGDEVGRGVAVYPTGPNKDKIVVVGDTGISGNSAMALIQRNVDGTVDASFGGGAGEEIIDPTTGNDSARGVAITGSGSILVAGHNDATDRDLVLTQLLPSGAPDGAFNLGAIRTITKAGLQLAQPHPLALQNDGKILIVGDSNDDIEVFRLNADGSTDTAFGTSGDSTFDVNGNDDGNAVALDKAGNLLVVGDEDSSGGFLARLVGSPDTDGDGVRDPVDACPTVAGTLPNGCPAPSVTPEAVLKGKKVVLNTVLTKKSASAKCPAKATVIVKTKGKGGPIRVTRSLKAKTVSTGCLVKGKVNLHAKPKPSARVKVTVKGTKLKTKHLVAVRS
jgi:uncharacterized delta-60 repeat protein